MCVYSKHTLTWAFSQLHQLLGGILSGRTCAAGVAQGRRGNVSGHRIPQL